MKNLILFFFFFLFCFNIYAQKEANYEESKVPEFTLPELLVFKNGKEVKTKKAWNKKRRKQILNDFEVEMFGKVPGKLEYSRAVLVEESNTALKDKAIRRQVRLFFVQNSREISVDILMYLPKAQKPAPVFLGLNFLGNQSIFTDPSIRLCSSYVLNNSDLEITDNKATEKSRGGKAERWSVEKLVNSGFGVVTACCGDIDPDRNDFSDGIHPLFYKKGQSEPLPDEWGTIAAWAWGLSRIMDYLEIVEEVNSTKVIVLGHSRLGKTALWAGAVDQRFAGVISNNSGCGGAALSHRKFGETVERINRVFPHWFCGNFKKYDNNEAELPFDQHMLIALIAPRPVYIASAFEDKWADPKGEYLAALYASQVYELFGLKGLSSPEQPPLNTPVMNTVSYHIREGKHNVTEYDWDQYIKFAKTFIN